MDLEADYCQKLQKVLEFLQSPVCQIHDDTLYQRLLDSLTEKSKHNACIMILKTQITSIPNVLPVSFIKQQWCYVNYAGFIRFLSPFAPCRVLNLLMLYQGSSESAHALSGVL
jgi:hypothetical protein